MWITIAQQTGNPATTKKALELLKESDPLGIGLTIIGMSVVFLALIILYVFLVNVAKVIYRRKQAATAVTDKAKKAKQPIEAEVNAAIAMALHLYLNALHDNEQTVLTINRMSKMYSPWSSKIYGLRQSPR